MKKIFLLLLLVAAVAKTEAQNYNITFAGTGASSLVDSVTVENITQCTSLIMSGSDVLNLSGSVGIDESATGSNNRTSIFPNPSNGFCSLNFETTTTSNTTISLFDVTGKNISKTQNSLPAGHHTYNLTDLPSGIYFVEVKSENSTLYSKIVSLGEAGSTPVIKYAESNSRQISASVSSKHEVVNSMVTMYYKTNDILKFTGKSGIYRTIYMLIPTANTNVTFNFVPCTDADGNNYCIVQIGSKVWMAENLRTTKYSDNTVIPKINDTTQWANANTPAYCVYEDSAAYGNTYGNLYNWYTGHLSTTNKNLAPSGWHIPTDVEWLDFYHYLGNMQSEKLRETCLGLWIKTSNKPNNSTGFSALPAGNRTPTGQYIDIRKMCYFWTNHSCSATTGTAWFFDNTGVMNGQCRLYENGFSIRCIKD